VKRAAILLLFLCVTYPTITITIMTKVMGRCWMFQWRHQLFHRRGKE